MSKRYVVKVLEKEILAEIEVLSRKNPTYGWVNYSDLYRAVCAKHYDPGKEPGAISFNARIIQMNKAGDIEVDVKEFDGGKVPMYVRLPRK